jgi:hypothetical protein
MERSKDRKKSKDPAAAAVELTDKELGEVAGGGDGGTWSGNITLTTETVIGDRSPSIDDTLVVAAGPGAGPHVKESRLINRRALR